MKTLLIVLVSIVALYVLGVALLRFVYLGVKPWNDHSYTLPQIREFRDEEGLRSDIDCYLIDNRDLHSVDTDSNDSTRTLPQYRVFDAKGHLLRQHCCFESTPGFLDSTLNDKRWSTRDDYASLARYLSHLRRLDNNLEPQLDSIPEGTYVVLYYWETTLGYNVRKMRRVLEHAKNTTARWIVIGVNCSRIDSLHSAQTTGKL